MTFRARIRNVRLKDGGTYLYELPREDIDMKERLQYAVDHVKNQPGWTLDGYFLIGFYGDQTRICWYRMPKRIPRELIPAYVAEIARTDAVTETEFHHLFEWQDASS